ncbi:MAG: transposase [Gemmatimonadaceae bacterium]
MQVSDGRCVMRKKRERRVFEAAFKIEAVRRMQERLTVHVPLSVIARDLGLRPQQLRGWEKQIDARVGQPPADVFPGEGNVPSAEEEVRRLRRENEVLRQERDFLRKTAAYFAKDSR